MTLTDFLLARIAERETDVRARETYAVGHTDRCIFEGGYEGTGDCDCGAVERVLAECEAKRVIAALHGNRYGLGDCVSCGEGWEDLTFGGGGYSAEPYPCLTLRNLALPYADHPDYQEAWRP